MKRGGYIKRKTPLNCSGAVRTLKTRKGPYPLKTLRTAKRSKRSAKKKERVVKTSTADTSFSLFIRKRDGKCLRCGTTENLTCSHYWGRGNSSTRFDPLNCITLCQGPYSNGCHDEWEIRKNQEYKDFMISWLGKEGYDTLEGKARSFKKRSEAVAEWQAFLRAS